jgi:DNA-binding response OmpR family regulator
VALDILLVDDDRDFAEILAQSLRDEGHRVCISCDGTSALVLAAELRPDAVLLDLGLPDADGGQVAQLLRRALPALSPIIVLTGRAQTPFVEDVDLTLNKPVQSELLSGLIEYVRRRRRTTTKPIGSSR